MSVKLSGREGWRMRGDKDEMVEVGFGSAASEEQCTLQPPP